MMRPAARICQHRVCLGEIPSVFGHGMGTLNVARRPLLSITYH